MDVYQSLTTPQNPQGVRAPQLVIHAAALDKMAAYVNTMPGRNEISGWAYVVNNGGGNYYVASPDDVFITKQTVSASHTESDGHTFALAWEKAARQKREDQLRLQWHSHPYEAYVSDIDLRNIHNYGATGWEWLISLVTNRAGDFSARLDLFTPHYVGVEMQVVSYRQLPQDLVDKAQAEINELVAHPTFNLGKVTR